MGSKSSNWWIIILLIVLILIGLIAKVSKKNKDDFEYFDEDGNMEFAYGINDDDYTVFYEGYYYIADEDEYPMGTVIFDLHVTEDYSEYQEAEDIYGAYAFSYPLYEAGLYAEYVEGDYLVYDVYSPDFYLY